MLHSLKIIRERKSEYCQIIKGIKSRGLLQHSLSLRRNTTQGITRATVTVFSFILFFSSSKTSRNRVAAILKISASVL